MDALRVAKIIKKDSDNCNRIFNEANLLKNLKHPGIPTIYDIAEYNDSICIIEEYISGKSLKSYVFEGDNLSLESICRIGIELCEIMKYLHSYNDVGIMHLDLKPDNIIISHNNQVKIIDFDNALCAGLDKEANTGSLFYAAPEQYVSGTLSFQTDIYSLGLVLLFMCVKSYKPDLRLLETKDVKRLYSKLIPIIEKCTRHNPKRRYQDMGKLCYELNNVLENIDYSENANKNISYVFYIKGAWKGIGVSYVTLSMAYYFARKHMTCLICDLTKNQHLLREALKGEYDEYGYLNYKSISFLPDYRNGVNIQSKSFDVIIVDGGDFKTQNNSGNSNGVANNGELYTSIEQGLNGYIFNKDRKTTIVNTLIVSGKYKQIYEKALIENIGTASVFCNLMLGKEFYQYCKDIAKKNNCYLVPYIGNWEMSNDIFDASMEDFIKDNCYELYNNFIRNSKSFFRFKGRVIHKLYEIFKRIY